MTPDRKSLDDLRIDRDAAPPRRSTLWILPTLLVLAGVGGAALWWSTRPAIATVRTALAAPLERGGSAPSTVLNATGYVTARRQATVSSKVTGKVVDVRIEEGMVVAEGQILARLDPANVDVNLRLAEAEHAAATSALEETRVRLAKAELDRGRLQRLVADAVASQSELDQAAADADALRARLAVERDDVTVAERQVALWRQQLEDTIIRAPFAGVVVSKNAQPGEMISPVSAGGGFTRTGICTVVDMASLEIEVDVNESYIQRVEPEQPVEAVLDAYPEWPIPSHVIAIIPTADRQKATVKVRIAFDRLDPRILPDMGVKVAFREEAGDGAPARRGVTVPAAAVREGAGGSVAFVVRGGKVERRAVELGGRDGDRVIVVAGLAAGDAVVVGGPPELAAGDRVQTEEERR